MKLIRYLYVVATLMFGTSAQATLSCDDLSGMVRLLDAASAGTVSSRTINAAYADTQRIQSNLTNDNSSHGQALQGGVFAQILMLMSEDIRRNDTDAFVRRLKDKQTQSAVLGASGALVRQGCPMPAALQAHADRLDAPPSAETDDGPVDPFYSLDPTQITLIAALVLSVIGGIAIMALLYTRKQNRLRHRNSRFYCDMAAFLETQDTTMEMRMLDINCHGAKIKPEDLDQIATVDHGKPFTLEIGYREFPVKVSWIDKTSFGITFDTPLKPSMVFKLLKENSNPEKKKDAATKRRPRKKQTVSP